eukprot:1255836-Pyramimonas_sp.AAC.1
MDEWRDSYAFLSLQLHGAQLQSIAALLFAVGRARWAMRRGRRFDLVQRLLRLVEHPWLSGSEGAHCRQERRARRARRPPEDEHAVTCRSDGAARGQAERATGSSAAASAPFASGMG